MGGPRHAVSCGTGRCAAPTSRRSATPRPAARSSARASSTSVAKEALLADDPAVFFTTPHFDRYPAILVRLERAAVPDLDEVIVEAWLCRAPKRLADAYLDARG